MHSQRQFRWLLPRQTRKSSPKIQTDPTFMPALLNCHMVNDEHAVTLSTVFESIVPLEL